MNVSDEPRMVVWEFCLKIGWVTVETGVHWEQIAGQQEHIEVWLADLLVIF